MLNEHQQPFAGLVEPVPPDWLVKDAHEWDRLLRLASKQELPPWPPVGDRAWVHIPRGLGLDWIWDDFRICCLACRVEVEMQRFYLRQNTGGLWVLYHYAWLGICLGCGTIYWAGPVEVPRRAKTLAWEFPDGRVLCRRCAVKLPGGGKRNRGMVDWHPLPCEGMRPVTEYNQWQLAGKRCAKCGSLLA